MNENNISNTDNTRNTGDIMTSLFETAKGWCVINDDNGQPDKEKTLRSIFNDLVLFTESVSLPDITSLTTAVCYYMRTKADDKDVEKAIQSLTAIQNLVDHLRSNLCTLGIFEDALSSYLSAQDGKEASL